MDVLSGWDRLFNEAEIYKISYLSYPSEYLTVVRSNKLDDTKSANNLEHGAEVSI